MKRRIVEVAIAAAAVAFAAGMQPARAQAAQAEPQPGAIAVTPPPKANGRVARAPRHAGQKATPPAGAPAQDPVFLSDAWMKQEKETDDKLKRFMNICRGC